MIAGELRLVVVASLLAACGGKGDECQRFVDKAGPVMQEMSKADKKPLTDADLKQLVARCRDGKGKSDPTFRCVVDAKDQAAVKECLSSAFKAYMDKGKSTEAALNLNKLGKNLKLYYVSQTKFPEGKAGPTPATPCCQGPDHKCPVAEWAKDPVWQALEFEISEPTRFQYTYESDGKTVRAMAISDLDCDGQTSAYTLDVSIGASGDPIVELHAPDKPD